MTRFQISISDLEAFIAAAKTRAIRDSSVSETLEFKLVEASDSHSGSDLVQVSALSAYAECNAHYIGSNADYEPVQ